MLPVCARLCSCLSKQTRETTLHAEPESNQAILSPSGYGHTASAEPNAVSLQFRGTATAHGGCMLYVAWLRASLRRVDDVEQWCMPSVTPQAAQLAALKELLPTAAAPSSIPATACPLAHCQRAACRDKSLHRDLNDDAPASPVCKYAACCARRRTQGRGMHAEPSALSWRRAATPRCL